ncbi:MAG: ABC transporter substrate-binding protein [Candidatus Tectomicrobia bacterium]|uniref:ABC transporter substrate-binding protein n=1 Tax=Tectimicrobiota bacterium TaxID=2528274 RepID=A0A933GK06_UNCTE|nr:ABC transporter substrate-binding protein [Candidatus Tectomicrobia bacterium]
MVYGTKTNSGKYLSKSRQTLFSWMRGTKVKGLLFMALTLVFLILALPGFALAADAKPLKMGIVYPLSGAMGLVGEGLVAGHKMAAEEIMKAGGFQGRKVEFIVRDDLGNPELTTRFTKELIIKEGVEWLLTGAGSAVGLAATAVAKEYKMPTFIIGGGTDKITTEEWNPYIFRYRPTCTAEGRAMARIAAEEVTKDIKNPKIDWISWDYEYGRALYEPFIAKLKELRPDVKIAGEAWPRTGETDYGPYISHMIAVKPDIVVNAIWGGGVIAFLKQGKDRGLWDVSKLLSAAEFSNIEYRTAIGLDIPDGTWSSTYDAVTWPTNEAHRKFYELYYKTFPDKPKNLPPHGFVSPSYYMVHLINKGMEKAKSSEPMAVIKAMEGLTMETYNATVQVRDFDHQVTTGYVWAPMIEKKGVSYPVLDDKRMKYVPIEKELFTKEEWLARRKAAGKE